VCYNTGMNINFRIQAPQSKVEEAILKELVAYVDGGCNNRTHSRAYGSFAVFGTDEVIRTETFVLDSKTSNQAEYESMIRLLEFVNWYMKHHKGTKWTIYCDSKLTVNQTVAGWKVNNPILKRLNTRARYLYKRIKSREFKNQVKIIWIPRAGIVEVLGH
jgi:ribonuclease HI